MYFTDGGGENTKGNMRCGVGIDGTNTIPENQT
jgi:hypothetical protein